MRARLRLTIAILLLIITALPAIARQDTVRRYYDGIREETAPDSATHTRKAWKVKGGWEVSDNYSNGRPEMKGIFTDTTFKTKDGFFSWYNEDGSADREGRYLAGKKEGIWKAWLEGGSKDYVITYAHDEYNGKAKWYHPNGQLSEDAVYKAGKLIKAKYWGSNGTPDTYAHEDLSDSACRKKENDVMLSYLRDHLEYPDSAHEANIQGKVYVGFSAEADGLLTNIRLVKAAQPLLNKEALRVIRRMQRVQRCLNHNRIVKEYFTLPIAFVLE